MSARNDRRQKAKKTMCTPAPSAILLEQPKPDLEYHIADVAAVSRHCTKSLIKEIGGQSSAR